MEDVMRLPPPMLWKGNISENWKKFVQRFDLYMEATEKTKKSDKTKVSILLHIMGEEAIEVYNTFTFPTEEDGSTVITLAGVKDKFEGYCTPKKNLTLERYNFNKICQQSDESVEAFVTRLRTQAKKCEYGTLEEDLITDRIVIGCRENVVRERMLREEGLKLERAILILKSAELVKSQAQQLSTDHGASASVNKISQERNTDRNPRRMITNCYFCGGDHARSSCPAYGTTCSKCGKKNHWAKQCGVARPRGGRSGRSQSRNRKQPYKQKQQNSQSKRVHQVEADEEDVDIDSLAIHATNSSSKNSKRGRLQALLCVQQPNVKLEVQVDTGAETNLLPVRCFRQMYPQYMKHNNEPDTTCPVLVPHPLTTLTTYDGRELQHYGTVKLSCSLDKKTWNEVTFYVCVSDGPIILGLNDSRKLELININQKHVEHITISVMNKTVTTHVSPDTTIKDTEHLKQLYPVRFQGQGKFPSKVTLHEREDAVPTVRARRKCPIHRKDEIQAELDRMESQNIIEKIPQGQPTEWLSSLAYSKKPNGKIRICLDPQDLNRNLKRTYHRSHTPEEITYKLSEARVFSKLDARNGYWSMELDDESSLLTAFSSPASNQRYKFKRLPFGLCVSQDLFQEAMDKVTEGLEGVISIHDDIVVLGYDESDHDRNLHALMKSAEKYGIVFNSDKTFVKVPEVTFFGNNYGAEGVKPDPERVRQVLEIPSPSTKQELQSFLGIIQYLSPFITRLSDRTVPLRSLLQQDEYQWNATHQKAFDSIKDAISSAATLNHFNPKFETIVQVDASKKGLGAALIQIDPADPGQERIVSFASKTLTNVEQRYANIEREYLAVVFGVEKFHTYLDGSKFVVQSDHSPLEKIHMKNLADTPPRLQRMKLRLQQYDFSLVYRKGAELRLADYLSRYPPAPDKEEIVLEQTIHTVQWSEEKLEQLRRETKRDPLLSALTNIVLEGWPSKCSELASELKVFWNIKDYISLDDGILLKGQQVIIPAALRQEVLTQIHGHCHQGVEKTRLLARKCVYWPNINNDIADEVRSCVPCNTYANSQTHEPMYERDLPSGPWEMLGSDLFELDGRKYLALQDYYSKFPIIRKLSSETSATVMKHLKQIFSEHGIPDKLYSDNGPCYSSEEFSIFAKKYGFSHITSSPHYPQSNGFIEKMVDVAKNTLERCKASGEDPELAFLFLRTTPISNNLPSPAELLYERPLRSTLPSCFKFNMKHENTREILQQRQQTQKRYFDRGSRELGEMKAGEPVMLQAQDLSWKPATVVSPTKEPRSYLVQTTDGARYRRNRKFLRKMSNKFADKIASSSDHNVESLDIPCQNTSKPITSVPPSPKPSKSVSFRDDRDHSVDHSVPPETNQSLRKSSRESRTTRRLIEEI